ncbi:MAG: hypothetical protein QM729_09685 [Solirubrobacterales bacterium]
MVRWVALVLAVLTGVVAIFSIWANDQLLDTGGWVGVSGRLLENQQVRHRVATFLGEELVSETEAQLDAAGQEAVAAEVVPRLRAEGTELAERVMKTRRFHIVWEKANHSGQRALLRVLDEEGEGPVVVDLTPALRQIAAELEEEGLAEELGVSELGSLVEPGAARIKVLEARELSAAQDAVRVVRHLTVPAVIATLALYLFALFLGRRRLARAFLGIGLALVATGVLALLARALSGHEIVDQLLVEGADRDAANAAWKVATSKISDLAGWAIGIGVIVVLLVGAFAAARRWRGWPAEGPA